MINLYYTFPSGSVSSSLYIYSDSTVITPSSYTDVTLEITASGYETSGSYSATVGTLRAYIKSGSIIYASFPLEETNIYYTQPSPSPLPPLPDVIPSFNVNYSFYPTPLITSSSDIFIITGSSLLSGSSTNIILSQSYTAGTIALVQGNTYTVILSGSGQFYNSSISIINTSTSTTSSYVTGSNSYISASFSSSNSENYNIETITNRASNIKLTFASTGDIPVSPTESLGGWNTYLNVYADSLINSGSSVYLLGGNLSFITSLAISSSKLIDFNSYGLNNLTSLYIARPTEPTGSLTSFPSLSGVPNIVTLNLSSNNITGSVPSSYSSSYYLQEFSCSFNKISGSIQNILNLFTSQSILSFPPSVTVNISNNNITGSIPPLSSSRVTYLDCSFNQLSGSISSLSGSYGLQYFNCSGNALISNIPTLSNAISLNYFNCSNNKLSGSIPEISSSYNLQTFNCGTNYLTGSLPKFTTSSYNLTSFNCSNNQLSGSIPNLESPLLESFDCNTNYLVNIIPSLTSSKYLTYFDCSNNRLSGSIPNPSSSIIQTFNCYSNYLTGSIDISNSSTLVTFNCSNNQLSGSINSLEGCVSLSYFDCQNNYLLNGSIPALYNTPVLEQAYFRNNKFNTYISASGTGYILPTSLYFLDVRNNLLPKESIDGILIDFDEAGGTNGFLLLDGTGNSGPGASGILAAESLTYKGWTVYTN